MNLKDELTSCSNDHGWKCRKCGAKPHIIYRVGKPEGPLCENCLPRYPETTGNLSFWNRSEN